MDLSDKLLNLGICLMAVSGLFWIITAIEDWKKRRKAAKERQYFQRAKWPDQD